ncbi:HAD-IIB family hydrolase [Luteococcus peritonei]|uniref:HAD-IIB family hydrolase n=1 Tax=Luteococcus peritonei TaxID=88874 RepID=A0ABW4RVI0_9ACTN
MTQTQLVVFDLDGTLLETGHRIEPGTAADVAALVADGMAVALASARLDESMAIVNQAIGPRMHRISYNGALTTLSDGTVVHEMDFEITPELSQALARLAEHGAFHAYTADGRWLAIGEQPRIDREEHDTWCTAQVRARGIEPLELAGQRCLKVVCDGTPEALAELEATVDGLDGVNITHSGLTLMDIWPSTSGKANGLLALCERLGIGPEQVLAVGDTATDVPMLQLAGQSIGVMPCAPVVQQAADHVVEGPGSPALFDLIRRLTGLPPRRD